MMKYRTQKNLNYVLFLILGALLGHFAPRLLWTVPAVPSPSPQETSEALSSPSIPDAPPENEYEYKIASTLRNCLGKYCYDARPNESPVDRVALLAPPHSGVEALVKILKPLLQHDATEVDLIPSTNVPPYGYGKNHGWNAIVRLYRPIEQHALSFTTDPSDTAMFARQTRQLVRWHCRLSHVAAHTRTLTVHMNALVSNPALELDRIITYVVGKKGGKYPRDKMLVAARQLREALVAEWLGTNTVPSALHEAAVEAMRDEYESTQGLTKWPCKSFREPDVAGLSTPAEALAANCSAPFTLCSVRYDQRGG